MSEYIVGLDIGSSKIYAAVGKIDENEENLLIYGISSVNCNGLSKGIVIDIDETAQSIKKCIEQLEEMTDIKIDSVHLAVPSKICDVVENKGVIAITSSSKEISNKDIEKVIEAAKLISVPSDKEVIGVIPKHFIIDDSEKIIYPKGMIGNKLEIDAQIVLARSNSLKNLMKSVNMAGIMIDGVELQCDAASRVVLSKEEKERGTVVLDVGAHTIDIYIYKDGYLCYTKDIPLGGKTITNDISFGLKVSSEKAENIKIKYGSLVYEDEEDIISTTLYLENNITQNNIIEIIEARVYELMGFVKKELISSGYYDKIENVVLIGGGITQFKGIVDNTREVLNKPVRKGSPDFVGAASPIFSTAVGVVVNAYEVLRNNKHITEDNKRTTRTVNDFDEYEEKDTSIAAKIKNFFADLF